MLGSGSEPVSEPSANFDANAVGELRSRYPEAARLAVGGQGGSFVAREHGGAKVVCKPVDPAALGAVREAFAILRRLSSPHLPAPRELWNAPGGLAWLVTDWVEGTPLELGPVAAEQALGEALGIARALAAIHDAGTHHGDVSLANVVRTPTHGCVLVDLAELGRLGTGTPGFIAPEVLAGGGGPAADRFALGCVLLARLCGALPLRRPQAVLGLDTARLAHELGATPAWALLPAAVRTLVLALLEPDRTRRLGDDQVLIHRLEQLHLLARSDAGIGAASQWRAPARWPYRGAALGEVLGALAEPRAPRLVAIVGPAHGGRTRTVEELVQRLQSEATAGSVARVGDDASTAAAWIDAWLALPAGHTLGFRGEAGLTAGTAAQQASTLVAAAGLAEGTAIVVLPAALGDALERRGPDVRVIRVRPWSEAELDDALATVVAGDRHGWVEALGGLTGGWSGRVVRAVLGCIERGIAQPEALALLGERVLGEGVALGQPHAEAVLQAVWTDDAAALATVPTALHDGARPHGATVAAARACLGAALSAVAQRTAAAQRIAGKPVGLALAIDADDAAAITDAVAAGEPASRSATAAALVAWVEGHPVAAAPGCVAAAARVLLALGMPIRALALTESHGDPEVALESARALQRLGRADDALRRLDVCDPEDGAAAGLRVRLLVDLGRVDEALATAPPPAEHEGERAGGHRLALATATGQLWCGYARLVAGQRDGAAVALDAAIVALRGIEDGRVDRRGDGIFARATQLLGNLAHDAGDLDRAAALWAVAAERFERADEPTGGLSLRGSLAGLAIPTFAGEAGIAHGRAAVRGLVAREQHDALATAAGNLGQLLARHGEHEELDVLVRTVSAAIGEWAPLAARARLARLIAERGGLQAIAAPPGAAAGLDARHGFDRAARLLAAADLHAEASEAHVRAAACARRHGRPDLAAVDLAAAQLEATRGGDDDPWRIAIEQVWIAVARRDRGRLQRWCEPAQLERAQAWIRVGQLERAWAVARAVWGAASVRLPSDHAVRQRAARLLQHVQEIIMDKTPSSDRAAVRGTLWADGERDALRELLGDIDDGPAVRAPPPGTTPAGSDGRTERLLRIHRRLAREDRLEPLLEQVIDSVMELTDAERGAVVVLGVGGERREVTRELGGAGGGVQFSQSVIERVLASAEPVLSVDAAADDRFDGSRSISHLNLRSVLAVPLRFRGELLGAVYVDHRLRRGNFDDDDLAHVEEFAELAALAVAHARALDEVRQQAERLTVQHAQLAEMFAAREAEVVGLRARVSEQQDHGGGERHGIIGSTEAMQRVYRLVDRLADTDVPVVVYGESGTGKELVARAIHRGGARRTGPFVAENCGAIPETLLESVLFGHAKGAFTGADRTRIGLFEAANGGTIFLDEVGEMSPGMQTTLLRVLQEGEVRRVGDNVSRPIDVRVIAASNRDLEVMVQQGTFRRDLYYRIHVVRIALPPLRERPGDIVPLLQHFLGRRGGKLRVAAATVRALQGYAWPGNVRELENEVQRWIALCDGAVTPDDLSPAIRGADPATDPDDLRIRPRVDRLERDLISRALDRVRGNQTRAAELLGLSRFGLQKKLRKLEQPGADADEG